MRPSLRSVLFNSERPPIGPFNKLGTILPTGYLIENIVFDPLTQLYWAPLTNVASACIAIASAPSPTGPWTIDNATLITTGGGLNQAPHLLIYQGTYYIYYGNGTSKGIHVQSCSTVNGTYGNDTSMLAPGAGGTWEGSRILEPNVFQRPDGVWMMLYMGDNLLEQVGYATASSPTGPWTKYASNPFIPNTAGTYDAGTVADPHPFLFKGVWYIFYAAGPNTDRTKPWNTAYCTTTDWVNITKQGIALPLSSAGFDRDGAFRGAISKFGNIYYFPYTGALGSTYQPGMATMRAR